MASWAADHLILEQYAELTAAKPVCAGTGRAGRGAWTGARQGATAGPVSKGVPVQGGLAGARALGAHRGRPRAELPYGAAARCSWR